MITYYSRKIRTSFDAALNKTVENLKLQGFGIITTIDLQEAFKKKLKVNFRNYKILGACNPELAYQGVSLESHVGIMIPCNVVIQEHENGEVEISALNPLSNLDKSLRTAQLTALVKKLGNKLRAAIDGLDHNGLELQIDALPQDQGSQKYETVMHG